MIDVVQSMKGFIMSIKIRTLNEDQVKLASAALRGRATVVAGAYIAVRGYEYINRLTKLVLETGEEVYMASLDQPFGYGGGQVPVNPSSAELTGWPRSNSGPVVREAEYMYANYGHFLQA